MADTPDDTPYQSLYRRFRPSTFGEVRGQDHVVLALRNAVRDERVAHAYLFSGPRGTGKTSTARILAKALNCTDLRDGEPCGVCSSCVEIAKGTSLDVHELDAASNNGVEAMRDLVSRAALGTPGRQKVYIVDEVHMLSTPASNALLKTLEEPPGPRGLRAGHHRPPEGAAHHPEPHPALRVPPARAGDPRRAARARSVGTPTSRSPTRRSTWRCAGAGARPATRSRCSTRWSPPIRSMTTCPSSTRWWRRWPSGTWVGPWWRWPTSPSAGFSPQQLAADLVDHLRQGFLALVAPDLVAVSGAEQHGVDIPGRPGGTGRPGPGHGGPRSGPGRHAGGTRSPGRPRGGVGPPGPPRGRRLARGACWPASSGSKSVGSGRGRLRRRARPPLRRRTAVAAAAPDPAPGPGAEDRLGAWSAASRVRGRRPRRRRRRQPEGRSDQAPDPPPNPPGRAPDRPKAGPEPCRRSPPATSSSRPGVTR